MESIVVPVMTLIKMTLKSKLENYLKIKEQNLSAES